MALAFLLSASATASDSSIANAAAAPNRAILQPTATISGIIRHSGGPVSSVGVHVVWSSGSQEVTTVSDGAYAVAGVPTGEHVMIFVRPPIDAGLAFRNWGTDSLAGDLVLDFDLESGHRLRGEFHKPDGTLYAATFWLGATSVSFTPPEGEWLGETAIDGGFDLVLPPDVFGLEADPRPAPYFLPHTRVDLRHQDVTGLVVTLLDEIPPPFPTAPPDVSAITVGGWDDEGYATVTGAAGAVEPLSAVLIANLSARNIITATADAGGAFSAPLYAPPGSSLLVKVDRDGGRVTQAWRDAHAFTVPDISYINPLPGTILQVGDSRGSDTQPFHSAGALHDEKPNRWAGWAMDGSLHLLPGTSLSQGQRVDFDARLRVTAPALNCSEPLSYSPQIHVGLRHLFDGDGQSDPWGIWFNAHLFTPTGLPIEHEASGQTQGGGCADASHLVPL
jgi:hypothetical protein